MKWTTILFLAAGLLGSLNAQVYQELYADSLEIYSFSASYDSVLIEKFIYKYDELDREILRDHYELNCMNNQLVADKREEWVLRYGIQYDYFYDTNGRDTLLHENYLDIEADEWDLYLQARTRINRFGLDSLYTRFYDDGQVLDSSLWFYNQKQQLITEVYKSPFYSPRVNYSYNEQGLVDSEFHETLYGDQGWTFTHQQETDYNQNGDIIAERRLGRSEIPDQLKITNLSTYRFSPEEMLLTAFDEGYHYLDDPRVFRLQKKRYWYLNAQTTPVNDAHPPIIFKIFPNPTGDHIQIRSNASLKGARLLLFDSSGKLCLQRSLNGFSNQIDLFKLPNGTYWISILDGQKIYTQSLSVQH